MNTRSLQNSYKYLCLLIAFAVWPALANAQEPVEGIEDLPVLSSAELEVLIGPIALYPDDLLAIVLPASTFPFQIVEAGRFLKKLESDSSLRPDDDWDDSVVALTNYPEVIELLNEDLDWTWRLGEAVVAQQSELIAAIEIFRDRAYAAGNLKSDEYQNVLEEDGIIEITPVREDVIYVPYYEPERVVVYQRRPVYYYYPSAYPLYYYPYPSGYSFHHDHFWGVTTAFTIGWFSDLLHVHHHSYHGHRYYGRSYRHSYWYRRPDIHVHNTIYVNNTVKLSSTRHKDGDKWRPQKRRTVRSSDQRLTRTRYSGTSESRLRLEASAVDQPDVRPGTLRRSGDRRGPNRGTVQEETAGTEIKFRERTDTPRVRRSAQVPERSTPARQAQEGRTQIQPQRAQERRAEPRQSQTGQVQRRQTLPTQVQSRPSAQPRQAQPRQTQSRPSVQPRQAQPRQTQSRPAAQPRQAQPRTAPTPASAPAKQSAPKPEQAKSKSKSSRSKSRDKAGRGSKSGDSSRDD